MMGDDSRDRFVRRFAATLAETGMASMPSRVFALILTTDSGRLTAAEIADQLRVSAAAVSGAVRYLEQVNMVARERLPGERRDHVVVHDGAWPHILTRRDAVLRRLSSVLSDGLRDVPPSSPAGHRLAETLAFFEFVDDELSALLHRWEEQREERVARTAGRYSAVPDA